MRRDKRQLRLQLADILGEQQLEAIVKRLNAELGLVGTFNTYYAKGSPNPKSQLLNLLSNTEEWPYEMVVIESETGNGATHLLHAALAELESQGKQATFADISFLLWQGRVYSSVQRKNSYYKNLQVDTEFLLLDGYCDDFTAYYQWEDEPVPRYYDRFIIYLKSLVKRGIKIIVTSGINSHAKLKSDFQNNFVVTSEYPKYKSTRFNIIRRKFDLHSEEKNDWFPKEGLKKMVIDALASQKYGSVRVLEATVFCFLSHLKQGKIDLKNVSPETAVDAYVTEFNLRH